MKKLQYFLSGVIVIFILECISFLVNDSFTFKDISWGTVIGIPLAFTIFYKGNKKENQTD
ncbi:hypothetical protein GH721_03830 [Kriegella sp. EG-1]|nr:hypothetical protein [Flavobacteriaceae bacterium EG-1]